MLCWKGPPTLLESSGEAFYDDRHMLDDLSITREQALDEAARPFWR
jgi:hypothetical protein